MTKYCRYCGAPRKPGEVYAYDEETGEPLYTSVCSKDPCNHGYNHEYEELGFFRLLLSLFSGGPRCKKCGEPQPSYD